MINKALFFAAFELIKFKELWEIKKTKSNHIIWNSCAIKEVIRKNSLLVASDRAVKQPQSNHSKPQQKKRQKTGDIWGEGRG